MENLLVVTALGCAFALNQHFQGTSELGRDGEAQTADAHNSRPRRGSCSLGKARFFFLRCIVGEQRRRQMFGGRDLCGS